ncbi:hypothetical protein N7481_009874 [Penicillium waksmanii]|uniref:uncharacterized protein n=1 Tax=Penicillium waksmanii TaxID=69791 RepID=UPI002546DE32|nr:uncharacterized protein N7481_009874 [Penicillium waksmanii]KAJ5976167.1 hypothetical protein N7481_009874 [Penicillium waksmanii]
MFRIALTYMYVQRKSETNRSDARMMHGPAPTLQNGHRENQNRPDARSSSPDRTGHAEQSGWTENEFRIMSIPPENFAGRAPLVPGSTFLATADYETRNDHSIPQVYTTPTHDDDQSLACQGLANSRRIERGWARGETVAAGLYFFHAIGIPLAGKWLDHSSVDGSTERIPIMLYS